MKKRYVFGVVILLIVIAFFVSVLYSLDRNEEDITNAWFPKVGQKLWTYNMNKYEWKKAPDNVADDSKDEITLQTQLPEGNGGYTSYHLLTGNAQVPKEDLWLGEGSQEFLNSKSLYSYFPKNFEYYEVIFNGVKFVPRKLNEEEISKLFKGVQIVKISDLKKNQNKLSLKYSILNNKFLILNDIGDDFYKYYVIPNDSKKLQLGDFSDQFKVTDKVNIKLQRLEGCTKAYPCYELDFE